jgi:hypothetical protein
MPASKRCHDETAMILRRGMEAAARGQATRSHEARATTGRLTAERERPEICVEDEAAAGVCDARVYDETRERATGARRVREGSERQRHRSPLGSEPETRGSSHGSHAGMTRFVVLGSCSSTECALLRLAGLLFDHRCSASLHTMRRDRECSAYCRDYKSARSATARALLL